ncbi:MAG: sensor histidine kinase [Mucilaginibacter sp.]|nr:sensor histidine kinase [Mucilaginibacter sp.]
MSAINDAGLVAITRTELVSTEIIFVVLILLSIGLTFLLRRQFLARKKDQINGTLLMDALETLDSRDRTIVQLTLEKNELLTELNHRVKNNLQIAISLLNAQSNYTGSPEAIELLRKNRARLYAMSLAHQQLYTTSDPLAIDVRLYLQDLVEYLRDEYYSDGVVFNFDVIPLTLPVDIVVPLGLIVNEAVINSLLFAFPGGGGKVELMLHQTAGDYTLKIADNGIGISSFSLNNSATFGKDLMEGLTKQFSGNFSIKGDNGVCVRVEFNKFGLKAS